MTNTSANLVLIFFQNVSSCWQFLNQLIFIINLKKLNKEKYAIFKSVLIDNIFRIIFE